MLTIGEYSISVHITHRLSLDGGAMFGAVPKTLWERRIEADEKNRIPMVTRLLLLRSKDRFVVVDTGCGGKWTEKQNEIFAFEAHHEQEVHQLLADATDVVLTHFHFDHAGGVSYVDAAGVLQLSFPEAKHYVQSEHWSYAKQPLSRESASFIEENIAPLTQANLTLTEDLQEILPGVRVHKFTGHTKGYQAVTVSDGKTTLAYPSDLIPTAHHVPVVWLMGYDICAERTVAEKQAFLEKAVAEDWLVVFSHDKDTAAGRIGVDSKGRFELREVVQIPSFSP